MCDACYYEGAERGGRRAVFDVRRCNDGTEFTQERQPRRPAVYVSSCVRRTIIIIKPATRDTRPV